MATEDFTTYTETDPNSHITVTSSKLDVDGMSENEDAHAHDDKGADHFGATFTHDVEVTPQETYTGGQGWAWCISNAVDDANDWYSNSSEAIAFRVVHPSANQFEFWDFEDTESDVANFSWTSTSTYYITVERTSETAIEARIYSDSGRSTLEDTLALSVTDGRRYQHVFGCNSWNKGETDTYSFDVENLDLNEAAGGLGMPVAMHHYKMMRG
ncbi:MAG: hypothetical protein PVH68_04750 [Armatimonadota bacterium]|jgi:hypothetical protein